MLRAIDRLERDLAMTTELVVYLLRYTLYVTPPLPEREREAALALSRTITARTGLSRSTIYVYVNRGLFPPQRQLGPRRVAWLASEVRAWIESRPKL